MRANLAGWGIDDEAVADDRRGGDVAGRHRSPAYWSVHSGVDDDVEGSAVDLPAALGDDKGPGAGRGLG